MSLLLTNQLAITCFSLLAMKKCNCQLIGCYNKHKHMDGTTEYLKKKEKATLVHYSQVMPHNMDVQNRYCFKA